MPEFWTLAEISKQHGAKRRTLLEWCSNGRWRGWARLEGSGGTKQWMVPDEAVRDAFKNQIIEVGNQPPALPPEETIRASYEATQALAMGLASSMAALRDELRAGEEAAAAREETLKQRIDTLQEMLAETQAEKEAMRKQAEERDRKLLEAIKQSRFRWPWQK